MKLINSLKAYAQRNGQFLAAACCALALTFAWQGLFLVATPNALAVPRDTYSQLASQSNGNAGETANQRAKSLVDGVAGSGTANKLQGQSKQAFGKAQQKAGEIGGQVKGAAKQVQGRAQKDIGRTENAAQKAGQKADNVAENAIDAVKDFFN